MISLLVPTRGRPGQVDRLWQTANRQSGAPGDLRLILRTDDDDPGSVSAAVESDPRVTVLRGPREVLSKCWNEAYDAADPECEVFMHCGDDIAFRTRDWDLIVEEEFGEWPDRLVFVHGRDGIQDHVIGTHGFLHRAWVEVVGYFVPPYFSSDFNDLWLTQVADAVGRRRYIPDLYTEHMHPLAGKGPLDLTHQERMVRHVADGVEQLYDEMAPQREADAEKVRAAIKAAE